MFLLAFPHTELGVPVGDLNHEPRTPIGERYLGKARRTCPLSLQLHEVTLYLKCSRLFNLKKHAIQFFKEHEGRVG